MVHEKDWRSIENNLTAIKKEMFPKLDPAEWELHAYGIWNSVDFFANEKLQLDFVKKQKIFSKIVDFICKSKIRLICVLMFKDRAKAKYANPRILERAWALMVKRFEHFLKQQPPETNNGLLFIDSSQKVPESEIKNIIKRMVRNDRTRPRIDHVIEDSIFVESHLRNLIQLADMIAYIIYKCRKGDPQFKGWFERLHSKMYRPGGKRNDSGIKEFPGGKIE